MKKTTRTWICASIVGISAIILSIYMPPIYPVLAQVIVGNYGVQYVYTAPSGSCASTAPMQIIIPTGAIYTCQSGTWATAGGSAPTGVAGGDLSGSYPNPTVIQLNGQALSLAIPCNLQNGAWQRSSCQIGADWITRVNNADAALTVSQGGVIDVTGDTPGTSSTTMNLNHNEHLILPAGTWIANGNPGISLHSLGVTIEGQGQYSTILRCGTNTASCIYGDNNAGNGAYQVFIHDLNIQDGLTSGRSSGDGIHLDNTAFAGSGNPIATLQNILISGNGIGTNPGFTNGVYICCSITSKLDRVTSDYAINDGFKAPTGGTSLHFVSTYASHPGNIGYETTPYGGSSSGPNYIVFDDAACDHAGGGIGKGCYQIGGTGGKASSIVFNGGGAESNTGSGYLIDSAYAVVMNAPYSIGNSGDGLTFAATTAAAGQIILNAPRMSSNTGYGINAPAGTVTKGCIIQNAGFSNTAGQLNDPSGAFSCPPAQIAYATSTGQTATVGPTTVVANVPYSGASYEICETTQVASVSGGSVQAAVTWSDGLTFTTHTLWPIDSATRTAIGTWTNPCFSIPAHSATAITLTWTATATITYGYSYTITQIN